VAKFKFPIVVALVLIVGVIFVIYLLKNKQLLNFGSVTAGAAIEATASGPNIYPVVGQIPRSGAFGLSLANNDTSYRDNVSFPCDKCNREQHGFLYQELKAICR
jgi:hypothetical protein